MNARRFVPLFLAAAAMTACQSGPKSEVGNTGGRVDRYTTTEADRRDSAASTVTLTEFADQVAEELPMRIAGISEFADREYRAVLYMNEIINETRTPTRDFRYVRNKVRHAMINSPIVAQYAAVYVDPERQERARRRFATAESSGSLVDEGLAVDDTGGQRYRESDIFVLNGEMIEATRGGGQVSQYVFDMTIVEMATDRIVFSSQITPKQIR